MRVTVFCVAVMAALLVVSGTCHAAGPKMELSMEQWDFGEIYQWTNPSVTVGIKNVGDETLKITDVKKSCGCTTAMLSNAEIKPGDKGFLKIDFASYTVTGKVSKRVRLFTNDPAAVQKDIRVVGFVRADKGAVGELTTGYVDLGVVAPYETRNIEVLINNHGNVDLDIRDIKLPDGYFMDSAFPKKAKVRGGVPVRFGYRPPRTKGPINDVITIETSGIDGGTLDMKVVGYIDEGATGGDMVILTPSGFTMSGAGENTLLLAVKNDGHAPVTFEDVDCSIELKTSKISAYEIAPGEAGAATLDIDATGLAPGTKGYVYIRLGLPVELPAGPQAGAPIPEE